MPLQIEPTNLHASRRGNGIQKWVNDVASTAVAQVLQDATMYYDIPAGHQVHITKMSLSIDMPGNVVTPVSHFNMVSTPTAGAVGAATDLCGQIQVATANQDSGQKLREWIFDPPIRVTYSSGVRSITMSVTGGDVTGTFTGTWQGWAELEI